MTIRPTQPNDFDVLQALYVQLFEYEQAHYDPYMDLTFPLHGEGEQYLRDVCANQNGRAGFVYEQDGKIVAYASLRIIPDSEYSHRKNIHPMQLQTLIVDEAYRGQGIGGKMVERAKEIARDNGVTHLRVSSKAKNTVACDLYKSYGFQEHGIMHEIEL